MAWSCWRRMATRTWAANGSSVATPSPPMWWSEWLVASWLNWLFCYQILKWINLPNPIQISRQVCWAFSCWAACSLPCSTGSVNIAWWRPVANRRPHSRSWIRAFLTRTTIPHSHPVNTLHNHPIGQIKILFSQKEISLMISFFLNNFFRE